MEFVQPIRDRKQLESMKKLLRGSENGLRNHCLFLLGINSGLRVSDLLALKIQDVLDERGKVRDRINLREKKTGKMKDFPIGASAKKSLMEYISSRGEYDRHDVLFLSKKGGSLSRNQTWKILSDCAKEIGISENIGTHTLRKTFGYHAYMLGTDITRIQKLLNHSSPGITLAYIGITQDELDDVYLSLDL